MAIKDSNDQVTTDPSEIITVVQNAWQQLFNNNINPSWNSFLQETRECTATVPCQLPPISGPALHRKILSAKDSRAVALDGWRIKELKTLPVEFYDKIAMVFQAVEDGAAWPDSCLCGTISTIPKEATEDSTEVKAGNLIANVGLATRPITNLSPLYCAYSSVRFEDMTSWREEWLPPCARGARKRNETHDLSWSLALTAENANSTNLHLGGISIDKRKFFDLLQHQIGHSLLQQLGAPTGYIAAQEQFYNQLKCRYKINKTFSEECCKTNGFAQGDSYSLQVALAMMATWTKYIH